MYRLTREYYTGEDMIEFRVLGRTLFSIDIGRQLTRWLDHEASPLYPNTSFMCLGWLDRHHLLAHAIDEKGRCFLKLDEAGTIVQRWATGVSVCSISLVEGTVYVGCLDDKWTRTEWARLAFSPDNLTIDIVPQHHREVYGWFALFTPSHGLLTRRSADDDIPFGWFNGWGLVRLSKIDQGGQLYVETIERRVVRKYPLHLLYTSTGYGYLDIDNCSISPSGQIQEVRFTEVEHTVSLYEYQPWSPADHRYITRPKRQVIKQLYLLRHRGVWDIPRELVQVIAGYAADANVPM